MTINEFYEKHRGRTGLKIAQMNAIELYAKTHNKVDYLNMLDLLRSLWIITAEENIDLQTLKE